MSIFYKSIIFDLSKSARVLAGVGLLIALFGLDIFAQERIRFRRGSSSTKVTGFLGCDTSKDYIIGAREGQRMTLVLWSKGATATVWNKWGTKAAMGYDTQTMNYVFGYSGDVTITVDKPCGGATAYDLKIKIK